MDKPENYIPEYQPSKFSDKDILITGATGGLGQVLVNSLSRNGANLYLHGRSSEKGKNLCSEIGLDEDRFQQADFQDFEQVRNLSDWISGETNNLDYLVNGAGGYFVDKQTSDAGYEMNYTVNYASHYLLCNLMIDDSVVGPESKIVSVVSDAYRNFDSLDMSRYKTGGSNWQTYCDANAFKLMLTKSLSQRFSDVSVCAVHPGSIPSTGIMENKFGSISSIGAIFEYIPFPGVRTKTEGVATIMHAMLSEQEGRNGSFYVNFQTQSISDPVLNESNRETVWNFTADATGVEWDFDDN